MSGCGWVLGVGSPSMLIIISSWAMSSEVSEMGSTLCTRVRVVLLQLCYYSAISFSHI